MITRHRTTWPVIFGMLFLMVAHVHAHDLGLVRITLTPLGLASVRLDAKLPANLDPASPSIDASCNLYELGQRLHDRLNKTVSWRIDCDPLNRETTTPVVLDWHREAALIVLIRTDGARRESLINAEAQGSIHLDLSELLGDNDSVGASTVRYLRLGIEHILAGIDHLAFLLGLCLIASGWRLVRLVTAFTLGHSLTLAAASLGWVAVPSPPTEAVIALSVAFIARTAVLPPNRRRHGFSLVMIFGLLHGLGFAGALNALGMTRGNLLTPLVSFNIGVEIGQLLFIGLIVTSTAALRRVSTLELAGARVPVGAALGSVAIFWTLERIAAFTPGGVP